MRITVPLTGEFLTEETGNPDNPVRPVNLVKLLLDEGFPIELADFRWELLSLNPDEGTADIELTFVNKLIPTRWDIEGTPVEHRTETSDELATREFQGENALRGLLTAYTKKQLHQKVGETELKRPK